MKDCSPFARTDDTGTRTIAQTVQHHGIDKHTAHQIGIVTRLGGNKFSVVPGHTSPEQPMAPRDDSILQRFERVLVHPGFAQNGLRSRFHSIVTFVLRLVEKIRAAELHDYFDRNITRNLKKV